MSKHVLKIEFDKSINIWYNSITTLKEINMTERQEKIYKILEKKGSISVEQMVRELYISEATARRELSSMELDGLLVRTWGGAVATKGANRDIPIFVRSKTNVKEKNTIARLAIELLKDNMTVFLSSSNTVARLATYFHKYENLTVITNGLETLGALNNHLSAKIILTGGDLYENYDFVGALAEDTIEKFNADLFFFSCSGITAEGFSSVDPLRLSIFNKMMKNSAKTVLLADTSKVGKKFTYNGFGLEKIDHVIMEKRPNDPALIKALGKKLITPKRFG